jgi:hypothetical protein
VAAPLESTSIQPDLWQAITYHHSQMP